MKIINNFATIILVLLLCLSGCTKQPDNSISEDGSQSSSAGAPIPQSSDELFTSRDTSADYKKEDAIAINLTGSSATSSSSSVEISGSTVKLTQEATYLISGNLDNGTLIIAAPDTAKLQIVLNGTSITSKTFAPLYIVSADKVFVTLADGTQNALTNLEGFVQTDENNVDGTIFSKQDLTFNGNGSLLVESPLGHGIVCKDDLVFTGGSYTINSANHGIDANDSIRAVNTNITADSGKDGMHCENSDDNSLGFIYIESGSYTLEAEGDGISANGYLQICGGDFNITSGGGSENGEKQNSGNYGNFIGGGGMGGARPNGFKQRTNPQESNMQKIPSDSSVADSESTSMKGLKSSGNILIDGGNFNVNSADDAFHSNASMYINGGNINGKTGDDGFHAEETLEINGGALIISESYEGIEGLDIKISGGNIKLTSSDDGLNAAGGTDQSGFGGRDNGNFGGMGMGGMGGMSQGNGSIIISGGNLDITASGDGIDANGTLEITGGYTTVCGPTQGDTATLDYDKTATISGGTFIGTGASNMAQSFSDSKQGVIAVSVGTASANTEIILKNSKGDVIIKHTPPLSFNVVILSSPEIQKNETYTITVGTQSGSFKAS